MALFWQAFSTTFAMLCIVGPICMTVINTTIVHGPRVGYYAGAGVSIADSVYIIVASLMIASLESILSGKAVIVVGMIGGSFLYYLAWKFWHTKPSLDSKGISGQKFKSFMTLFLITISGPTTILTYSIVFSSFIGMKDFNALHVILGACCGTFGFYILMVSIIGVVRQRINEKILMIMNKFASTFIVILASVMMYNSFKSLLA